MKKNTPQEIAFSCVDCAVNGCNQKQGTPHYPDFCITTNMEPDFLAEVMRCYEDPENCRLMIAAAEVEFEHYCQHTRVEETVDFAKKIGAKKIGIAFCAGMIREAKVMAKLLRFNGFEVFGVACKAGVQPKTSVGIPQACEDFDKNMCNPVMQAKVLNRYKTDLNVVVGLCVGHDSLFYKHSKAPVTTCVAKDRVLMHNPAAALYGAESYYRRKLFPENK